MICFEMSEEQRAAEQMIRDFTQNEVAPRIQELDAKKYFDRNILKQMGDLHLMGICLPEKYGGAGMDYVALGLVCEELEYVDTSLRVIMSVHMGLNSLTLLSWGNENQKERYLIPQALGEKIATFGLTEPNAGSDALGIQCTAVRRGDHYVLNGEKVWISLADVADNFLVIAWTDLEKKKNRDHTGLSCFIIERSFKGFTSGTMTKKWGIMAGNTGWFSLQDVEVPEENLLGHEGEGMHIAMFALDQGRYTVAAGATGLIRACLDASTDYAKERTTFGKPIGRHQLVKQMIANMVRDYDCARLLWLRSGWLKNAGVRNTRETSLAKWFATVASERAASDAIQIHGAYGYSDDFPVGRYWRNSKGAVIYEGTREIHTLMQADYALGYRVDKPVRCSLPKYYKSDSQVKG
jgi:glutaryl-CoA dehydrogenase (non-decarboxylating)